MTIHLTLFSNIVNIPDMNKHRYFGMIVCLLTACVMQAMAMRENGPEWYRGSSVVADDGTVIMDSLREDGIDLLYFVSTEVMEAKQTDGTTSYCSLLTAADRSFIDAELAFVGSEIGRGDFNYLAPYYHEYTFEALALPKRKFGKVFNGVCSEVRGIFDYYIKNVNNGRRFALVGFSQGAMVVLDILKHSSKKDLQNMVGAYLMGYGVSKRDIKCANVIPATGAEGFGHTVSFNSVLSKEGTWPAVYNSSATVINPVNWQTTTEPATFVFNGDTISVAVDKELNELMVTVPDKQPYYEFMNANPAFGMLNVSPDCLHHWDLLYYTKMLHDNILLRAKSR